MEEARVRELMALADEYVSIARTPKFDRTVTGWSVDPAPTQAARARLESALRQEPVDSHARQTFRPKELPMNPMQEAMRPFSDLSGGEQEPQGGMSEEEVDAERAKFEKFVSTVDRPFTNWELWLAAAGGRK